MAESAVIQVSAGTEDLDETEAGTVANNASTTALKGAAKGTNKHRSAYRFTNAPILPKSTILKCRLQLWITEGTAISVEVGPYNPIPLEGSGWNANAPVTATTEKWIEQHTPKNGVVEWAATGTVGAFNESPDMSGFLQNIVNNKTPLKEEPKGTGTGWASGDAILIYVKTKTTAAFTIENFEGSAVKAAKLELEWTPPVSGSGLAMMV